MIVYPTSTESYSQNDILIPLFVDILTCIESDVCKIINKKYSLSNIIDILDKYLGGCYPRVEIEIGTPLKIYVKLNKSLPEALRKDLVSKQGKLVLFHISNFIF